MWVRPILTMSAHSRALAAIASRSAFTAGISRCFTLIAAAMYIADGKRVVRRLRHVDVVVGMDRLLASQRRAGESGEQRFEITSFTFMLNCVPLPVIQTCSGNMS